MDWQNIIKDLLGSGLTQMELAKALGVSQALIHDIYAGKRAGDPQWRHGQQLIALHKRRCKKRAA
jgi:predicted transcriptional regulator